MIGTGNRIRPPARKPETSNQFPQRPKGAFPGFLVVDLTDEDRLCERGDSNPMRTVGTYLGYRGFATVLEG